MKAMLHFLSPAHYFSFSAKSEAVLCVLESNQDRMLASRKESPSFPKMELENRAVLGS